MLDGMLISVMKTKIEKKVPDSELNHHHKASPVAEEQLPSNIGATSKIDLEPCCLKHTICSRF